jgi:hypothetical protein
MEKQEKQIPVELSESAAEGIYSNFVLTSHTPSEFVLDFARILPGLNKAKIHSRIVMTPQSAKSLLSVLSMTIEKFEGQFGEIELKGKRANDHVIGFQTSDNDKEEKGIKKKK